MLQREVPRLRGCYRALNSINLRSSTSIRQRTRPTFTPIVPQTYPLTGSRTFSVSTHYAAETTLIHVPSMAESISEGVLATLNKHVGDYVEQDEEIASIETDKIDVAVNASHSGTISKILVGEGDTVTVGQAVIEISLSAPPTSQTTKPDRPAPETPQEPKKPSPSSPPPSSPPKSNFTRIARQKPNISILRNSLRNQTERLKESQNTAAFLTTFNEVDMSNVMEFRAQNKDSVLDKHGVKLGFMGPVARASALALREIPAINASIENNGTVVFRDYIDLSVAVATPKGLVTPVVWW